MLNVRMTAVALLLVCGALNAQVGPSYVKSFGNSDASANLSFAAQYYTPANTSPSLPYSGARGQFEATGSLLRHGISIINVGGEALSTPGGTISFLWLGSINVPADTHARVWLEIGGITLVNQSNPTSAAFSYTLTQSFGGLKRSYGVGPVSVKVTAGVFGSVTPALTMSINPSTLVGTCSAGLASVKATVSASGGVSVAGYGVTVTNNTTLVDLGATVSATNNAASSVHASLNLTASALRLLMKLKLTGFGTSWTNELFDKTIGSWTHSIAL